MRIHLYIFTLLSLLLASCGSNGAIPDKNAPDTTPQTTLMYMTGTNLSYYFGLNISAAKSAIAEDALGYGRFLIFKHTSSSSATLTEYKYENGECVTEVLKEYSYISSLSHDAIVEVIADTKAFAPADTYNLIVSGHATGWVPTECAYSWSKVARDGISDSATSEQINWDAMTTSPITTRYMGCDEDGYLDIEQLQECLEAAATPLGYILFDQCFMSSIEALYNLRNLCDYIIASPCEIMGAGFPYNTVLPKLFSNSGREYDLQGACEAYYNYYTSYSMPSGCVALTVTSELDALADITRLINNCFTDDDLDLSSIQAYERLADHLFFDFEQYMLAKCGDDSLDALFSTQMERAYPSACRLHTDRFFANIGVSASSANSYDAYYTTIEYYSGVTTSAPSSRMREQWAATAWAQATTE